MLEAVAHAVGTLQQVARAGDGAVLHVGQHLHVDAGAEALAGAGQHHGPHAAVGAHLFAGRDQRVEHRAVQGVGLVGAHQGHAGHLVVADLHPHAIIVIH